MRSVTVLLLDERESDLGPDRVPADASLSFAAGATGRRSRYCFAPARERAAPPTILAKRLALDGELARAEPQAPALPAPAPGGPDRPLRAQDEAAVRALLALGTGTRPRLRADQSAARTRAFRPERTPVRTTSHAEQPASAGTSPPHRPRTALGGADSRAPAARTNTHTTRHPPGILPQQPQLTLARVNERSGLTHGQVKGRSINVGSNVERITTDQEAIAEIDSRSHGRGDVDRERHARA